MQDALAAIEDQPAVHKESEQVPDIESYIIAPFPKTLTLSGDANQLIVKGTQASDLFQRQI